MNEIANHAKTEFEKQWRLENLETEIANCPQYDIYPTFEKYIARNMRILESGCGLGRWVFHYHRRGYDITGLDWSQQTVDLIKSFDHDVRVVCGDARKTDFKNGEFDLVLSLGTVEHSIEGPAMALADTNRILKKNGILIVTVPLLTPFRRSLFLLKRVVQVSRSLCYSFRRKPFVGIWHVSKVAQRGPHVTAIRDNDGYHFFQYEFQSGLFERYLQAAGFQIIESFPTFKPDGLYNDLGALVGQWDFSNGRPHFNPVGRLLLRLLPNCFYHMFVCVARKA